MYILPSRGRPHNMRRFIDACKATNQSMFVYVYLDEDDPALPEYQKIKYPSHWLIHVGEPVQQGGAINAAFNAIQACCYGLLGDDVIPRTKDWDTILCKEAGDWNLAYGEEGKQDRVPQHFVVGGKLAREVGYMAYPGMKQLYIDSVWQEIGKRRGCLRYRPDVFIEHMHWSIQGKHGPKGPKDEIYANKRNYVESDRDLYRAFMGEPK